MNVSDLLLGIEPSLQAQLALEVPTGTDLRRGAKPTSPLFDGPTALQSPTSVIRRQDAGINRFTLPRAVALYITKVTTRHRGEEGREQVAMMAACLDVKCNLVLQICSSGRY